MRAATAILISAIAEFHLGALAYTKHYHAHRSKGSNQVIPVKTTIAYEASITSASAYVSGPSSYRNDYIAVIQNWRTKMGLKALTYDSKLESNAMDTIVASEGVMVHKLNAGTFAQVLAPNQGRSFEEVLLGGWLCEIPSLPGLDGICVTQSEGWAYNGQTGHAEILTSDNYSKIGCALHAGVQCCDLA